MTAAVHRRDARPEKEHAPGENAMFEILDRQARLTGNQIKILAAAIIGDALEFFDYFPVSYTHLDVYKRQERDLRADRRGEKPDRKCASSRCRAAVEMDSARLALAPGYHERFRTMSVERQRPIERAVSCGTSPVRSGAIASRRRSPLPCQNTSRFVAIRPGAFLAAHRLLANADRLQATRDTSHSAPTTA